MSDTYPVIYAEPHWIFDGPSESLIIRHPENVQSFTVINNDTRELVRYSESTGELTFAPELTLDEAKYAISILLTGRPQPEPGRERA